MCRERTLRLIGFTLHDRATVFDRMVIFQRIIEIRSGIGDADFIPNLINRLNRCVVPHCLQTTNDERCQFLIISSILDRLCGTPYVIGRGAGASSHIVSVSGFGVEVVIIHFVLSVLIGIFLVIFLAFFQHNLHGINQLLVDLFTEQKFPFLGISIAVDILELFEQRRFTGTTGAEK